MRDAGTTSQVNLSFEIHGIGNPILFLHGLGANIYSWRSLVPLSDKHQLIFIDLKGFGASPKPLDKHYSARDQAELIYEFIIQNDLRNLILVGHSFGGAVALLTALKLSEERSDRLSGLVLIDSAGYKQPLPGYISVLRVPILGPLLLNLLPSERAARSVLKLACYDRSRITREQVAAYAAPLDSPGGRHALVQTAKQIIPPNIEGITSRYQNISVPTLILWGRQDRIVSLKIGQQLHGAITNSRLVILESCGHIPQEEKPTEALGIIAGFLMALNKPA
jgi:pimeloyl-ACP methyl ester carboxylesterase